METRTMLRNYGMFLTMLLLIVSNSKWLAQLGIEAVFEYGAYFLVLSGVFLSFLFSRRSRRSVWRTLTLFGIVSVLFCVGIAVQGLPITTRLRLMATMLVISAAILAEDYINSLDTLRAAGYGIVCGTAVTTVMALLAGVPVMETVYDGFLSLGFTGGVQYKNFFGAFMLGSFMSLYFYHRYQRQCWLDRIVMGLELVLIFLSSARGTYIFVFVFLIVVNYERIWAFARLLGLISAWQRFWKRLSRTQRILLVCGAVVIAAAAVIAVYLFVVRSSSTYGYRFRGVRNYLKYAWGDWFHLIFGNAEMAWSGVGEHYVQTIQKTVGWDGTYEMGFINTLIKNGILGLVGFAIMYIHIFRLAMASKKRWCRLIVLSVMSVLLVSSLVESFVCNIHSIFGVYCYLVMAGVCGMSRPRLRPRNVVTPLGLVLHKWDQMKRAKGTKES